MPRNDFSDPLAFLAVAREGSFTRAAAQLGISQSGLSHTIRALETRMGIRLLTRSTRSVSPTEAGERLLLNVGPRFEEIEAELAAMSALRDKPAGTIRISTHDHVVDAVIWPKLKKFLPMYPDIKVEINVNYELIDIVAERYDAGVRFGDMVAKDMIATRIAPDLRMAVVGSPAYFATRPPPNTPQDLADHNCINLRLPTHGGIHGWEFVKDGRLSEMFVSGQLTFNSTPRMLEAALDGFGVTYLPEDQIQQHVDQGLLAKVLEPWCPTYPGYHLYYPSRRQPSPAFSLLVDALRYRT